MILSLYMSVSGSKFLLFMRIPVIFGASQVALVVRNVPANAGDIRDAGSVPGSERSQQPTRVFFPGESHGRKILVGYSP